MTYFLTIQKIKNLHTVQNNTTYTLLLSNSSLPKNQQQYLLEIKKIVASCSTLK